MYFLILFACLGGITSARGGSIVFSNLIGGNPLIGGSVSICDNCELGAPQAAAMPFVPAADFTLVDAQVYVGNFAHDGSFESTAMPSPWLCDV
jgi:hypothetical protein